MNELFERELWNISINDVSLADYVKENYVPMSVIEDIKKERYNNGFYDGYRRATEQANAVIEDIKAEIEEKISRNYGSLVECGMEMALETIDKHISRKE